jgi:hypothetical protein
MYVREIGWDHMDLIYVPEDKGKFWVLVNTN